jgi:hypothetical protein
VSEEPVPAFYVTLALRIASRRCRHPIIVSNDSNDSTSNAPPPLRELDAAMPVPLSATVCVPAPPPAFTLKVAVADPTEAGSNTTLIVQLAPAATDAQLLVCENG